MELFAAIISIIITIVVLVRLSDINKKSNKIISMLKSLNQDQNIDLTGKTQDELYKLWNQGVISKEQYDKARKG